MARNVPAGAEAELEDIIRESPEPIALLFVESWHPGGRSMGDRLQELLHDFPTLRLIQLNLSIYRSWAGQIGIHGTPGLAIFKEGRFVDRLLGVTDESRLREFLEKTIQRD